LEINDLVSRFCDEPIFVICEVQPKSLGLPITSYLSREETAEVSERQYVCANLLE